ncbi:hypothetical protein DEO72_LG11g2102 [Vigna unguiculata]|uniref:Uncharacterized protein n=1 Tax=Vigna unguiculata TaxID=3917 RepID=A0A4D6NQZ7_VIGUN|nr:hypothetical protein DEO72_LG11g2102 [Vigna unguiculata]
MVIVASSSMCCGMQRLLMVVHGGPTTWLLFRQTMVVFKHGVEQHSRDDNGKFVMLMRAAMVETSSMVPLSSRWCIAYLVHCMEEDVVGLWEKMMDGAVVVGSNRSGSCSSTNAATT